MTLEACLRAAGLAHLLPAFEAEGVTLQDLLVLSSEDLAGLGVTRMVDRARLKDLARQIREGRSSDALHGSTRLGTPPTPLPDALSGRTHVAPGTPVPALDGLDGRTQMAADLHASPTDGLRGPTLAAPSSAPLEACAAPRSSGASLPARIGSYAVRGRIGSGGMGEVLRARHVEEGWAKRQGGDVAIKLIHPQLASDSTFRERFFAEAALGKRIAHPAMVSTHEVVAEGEILAMVMTLVEGEPLTARVKPGGLLLEAALALLRPVGEALDHLHGIGIVHRDIKPANILVRTDGSPVVLDLGIAKDSGAGEHATKTATAMGTVAWMAPEQADARNVDGAADRYALGLLAYVLLSGRMPWSSDSSEYRIAAVKFGGQLEPLGRVVSVPPHVDAAVMRMLALEPTKRFMSCAAFVDALRPAGAVSGPRATQESPIPNPASGSGSPASGSPEFGSPGAAFPGAPVPAAAPSVAEKAADPAAVTPARQTSPAPATPAVGSAPPGPSRWTPVAVGALALVGAAWGLQRTSPDSPRPIAAVAPVPAPSPSAVAPLAPVSSGAGNPGAVAAAVPTDTRSTPSSTSASQTANEALSAVRAGRAVDVRSIQQTSCVELWQLRNWVYARHGFAFASSAAQTYFRDQPGYRCDPSVNPSTIAALLSTTDQANVQLLKQRELRLGCDLSFKTDGVSGCP